MSRGRLTPTQALAHLAALPPSSIKMGLDRVKIALAKLANPERRVPAVHVAGTNGKGSTCAMIASCLSRRYRTGLYTSPHLIRVNERIRIDGQDIEDGALGRAIADVIEVLGVDHDLTYFELGTVVAFHHFAKEQVQIAVLETGLGGRLDATTACHPVLTCITPIAFDHMEYLGNTLTAIAGEKAGIIKPGVPCVSAPQEPEALSVLQRATEIILPVPGAPAGTLRGRSLLLDDLVLPLRGRHQHQNASVALTCLEVLADCGFPLTPQEIRDGLEHTYWPGRLEEFATVPPVVLDGAHNPAGVEVLLSALDDVYAGRPVHLVFGVFADKDSEPMMRRLFPRCAALYLAPIASPRSRPPEQYEAFAATLCRKVSRYASAEEALSEARASAPSNAVVLVAGSLFLVGQLRRVLVEDAR